MSGPDKPPQIAYTTWARANDIHIPWSELTPTQQHTWQNIANAVILASGYKPLPS